MVRIMFISLKPKVVKLDNDYKINLKKRREGKLNKN
ncbi:hypothetical protein M2273_001067 [Mucilaginibacter lappiensis]|jgi:hypothetical protein